ncbi:hydratase [uncultured Fusobacterium sp.]|uniref:hydratase n=1 Tax=uncultured Fusobacterium sp. TaxID=159267 RepID=UPI0015A523A4|nr:hydratase [uncultured Fusobacterium sp.]
MIKLYEDGIYLLNGKNIVTEYNMSKEEAKKGTIAYSILKSHNTNSSMNNLKIKFDAMASHDITFVGIIQTAKASGMKKFPLPYVLTNCHNSLCAVGGTINEDDHMFGLSAAKKYGGIYVPPHIAVIHQFMREKFAGCGKMILGSDSHTRYGALGTIAIGEGGGELVKQLLEQTYDITYPEVIAIYLDGKPKPWVGPQDIALAIIGAVFKKGYVKNKIVEFVGPGVSSMTTDFRNGVDVMTTETACLSSIWRTDEDTREFLKTHKRENEYKELNPQDVAYYDGCVYVDLDTVKPMIALPFHPSNVYEIDELKKNPYEILKAVEEEAFNITGKRILSLTDKIIDEKIMVQQGVIAGCAGGNYTNLVEARNYLKDKSCGNGEFSLSIYPSSQPVFTELLKQGVITDLTNTGAIIRTAFCGPCFGAGDTPVNNGLSIRHTTRNFPNREGSKPGVNQMSAVALMDARSIAATALNGGILTSAEEVYKEHQVPEYKFDETSYENRVFYGFEKGDFESELKYGPNIKDWPEMRNLADNILLKVCSKIMDPVTTTDELIPSGETSSYRSNPLGLAEFTLSRRDPEYVGRAKEVDKLEKDRATGNISTEIKVVIEKINKIFGQEKINLDDIQIGSTIYAIKPGDGSAREQAASCQRVLGGLANISKEYATKRYRSNLINWGMIPFIMEEEANFEINDYIYVPQIKDSLNGDMKSIKAYVISDEIKEINLSISYLTDVEKEIIKAGCLINYNKK